MDVADFAQRNNEAYLDAALKTQLAKSKIATPPDRRLAMTSGECCDCGDKIDPARMAANPQAARCIACQTIKEREDSNGNG
jgi:phage/conjugal plasmid C-4 type zinc finger TraR family protein